MSNRCSLSLSVSLLLCLSSSSSAQVRVHVVDSSGAPGTPFTDIAAAITAAHSGDVLLVRHYLDYAYGHAFPGKRLSVVGEAGPNAPQEHRIQTPYVSGLGANDFVLFQNVDLRNDLQSVSYA